MLNIHYLLLLQLCFIHILSNTKNSIKDLFEEYKKDLFSGYLKTDKEGNELFYVFALSQNSPEKDPLFLWLNGGPGCSSLAGFLEEIGPIKLVEYEQRFEYNEYSWNKNASVIFIETPAGVGFTKAKNSSEFINDTIHSASLHRGLLNFFELFPEYKENDFYISGESYAGIYIPYLVKEIINNNNKTNVTINLKGILIGNPYTFHPTDFEDSMVEFGYSHGIIGLRTFKDYLKECDHWSQVEDILPEYKEPKDYKYDPVIREGLTPTKNVTKKCNEVRTQIKEQFDGINFYGIFKECVPKEKIDKLKSEYKNIDYDESLQNSYKNSFFSILRKKNYEYYLENNKNLRNLKEEEVDNKIESEPLEKAVDFFPECGRDEYSVEFLNKNTTKQKLGVDETKKFLRCNLKLNYKWGESIDFYKNDLQNLYEKEGFKAWIFSGTEDIAITTLGTLRWINSLNYTIDDEWKPWKIDGQIVGMEQHYTSGLRMITIKGVGHMVPEDNPKIAKALFDKFLTSKN